MSVKILFVRVCFMPVVAPLFVAGNLLLALALLTPPVAHAASGICSKAGVLPLGTVLRDFSGEAGCYRVDVTSPGVWEGLLVLPGALEYRPGVSVLSGYLKGRELVEAKEFEQGVSLWRDIIDRKKHQRENEPLLCWLHLRIGETWTEERAWQKAHTAFRAALKVAHTPKEKAAIWNLEGRTYTAQSNFSLAEISYRSAMEAWRSEWGEGLGWAHGNFLLGTLKAQQVGSIHRRDLAEDSISTAIAIQERLAPRSFALARSLSGLGIVLSAEEYIQQALEVVKTLNPESTAAARGLSNLGRVVIFSDRIAARTYLQQALEIMEQRSGTLESTSNLADLGVATSILTNLGIIAHQAGDWELAEEYYLRGLSAGRHPGSMSNILSNLGSLAVARGDIEKAENFYQQSLAISSELAPVSARVLETYTNMGNLARLRGDFDKAEKYYQDSLRMRKKIDPELSKAGVEFANLGDLAAQRGRLELAEEYYLRAGDLLGNTSHQINIAKYWASLGALAMMQGKSALAETYYYRVLEHLGEIEINNILMAVTLNRLAILARDRGELDVALSFFYRAVETLEEQMVRHGGSHSIKRNFRVGYGHFYRDLIELLLKTKQYQEAFSLMERSRARGFLELLAQREMIFPIPEEVATIRRSLTLRFDRTQKQMAGLNPADQPEELEEFRKELAGIQRERTQMVERIRKDLPQFAALEYPQPLDLREAQGVLDPGTVMLSYSVGKDQTDLFVVTAEEDLEVHTLAIGADDLQEEVRNFRKLIDEAEPDNLLGIVNRHGLNGLGKRLYQWLVKPAEDALKTSDRVLIIPDGPLHLLPFGALIRETSSASNSSDGQYFAEWKPLHTVLSATVYAEIKKTRRTVSHDDGGGDPLIAAFGDPHYSLESADAVKDGKGISDARVRSAWKRRLFDWGRLPESRREVLAISGFHRNVQTYLGEGATEERVKALGGDVRIVHFATHGHLDHRFPLNSALVLTLPAGFPKSRDNGLLQAWEIFESVRLDADLVVLSACESGLGEEQKGEGLIGLTRAFQYAGARTVAASLWQVDDRLTAELMIRFYRHLRSGKSKDKALQAAQVELIQGPIEVRGEKGRIEWVDASAPYYWAAFQMIGDWR